MFASCTLTIPLIVGGSLTAVSASHPEYEPATLLAVGDIGACSQPDVVAEVADQIRAQPGTVALLGDIAYPSGTAEDYADCFDPYYQDMVDRLRPSPGNHDYGTPAAASYFDYFGARAGTRGQGWDGYDLGSWRIISLNSNCSEIGGCGPGSPQFAWLESELETHPSVCRIAYWHHPRFTSSGTHGGSTKMGPIVELLHAAGTEAVLAGHAHQYERFDRLDPAQNPDPDGIRFFVIGTGGKEARAFATIQPGSEIRQTDVYGALELTLSEGALGWDFRSVDDTFQDSGSQICTEGANTDLVALYRATFGRVPDAAGLAYWTNLLSDGLTFEQIAGFFAEAEKFEQRFGAPTDSAFIDLVYQNVLGRDPEPAGMAYWLTVLEATERSAILVYFSQAEEFHNLG